MTPGPLRGRVAIVTGANHGIGAATAAELGRLGCDVLVSYLRLARAAPPGHVPDRYVEMRASDAQQVVDHVRAQGRSCVALEENLADPGAPRRLFERAERDLGPVAILVNNASGWRQDTFGASRTDRFGRVMEAVSRETFESQFLVDARAAALLIGELAQRLRRLDAPWGRIVSLASGGPGGFPEEVSYGAAKAALVNYTMSAATELAPLGVTANVVHPPVTDTGWVTDEVRRAVSAHGGRVVEPGEVAGVIGWLCTDAARAVTGNAIRLR